MPDRRIVKQALNMYNYIPWAMENGKIKNIILVDDDEAIFHTIQIVLNGPEYKLVYFSDVPSAIRHIKSGKGTDLIILDIMMPGHSGLDFLDMLRNEGVKVPVIVISAIDTARAAVKALKKGAADYITKPFELEDIKEAIYGLLKE